MFREGYPFAPLYRCSSTFIVRSAVINDTLPFKKGREVLEHLKLYVISLIKKSCRYFLFPVLQTSGISFSLFLADGHSFVVFDSFLLG